MARRLRKPRLNKLALPVALVAAHAAQAQNIPGLDKGHQILLDRGLQIQATAVDFPQAINWSIFDGAGWNAVDFSSNFYGPQNYLGAPPGDRLWTAWYHDYSHTSFTSGEAPYGPNCVAIQLMDEQNLNDATVRANIASWFTASRANFPNTILHINQIPFQATDANFRDFMQTSQPDMLMIDSYRWVQNNSQGSWNLFSDMQRHRKFGLSGNDGTGAHPIPYGLYPQAITSNDANQWRVPSESELRVNHFAAWAMGYTLTRAFTYNTYFDYAKGIFFQDGYRQDSPTPSLAQVTEINRQGKNLGPAMVRLLSTDVRFVAGQHRDSNNNIVTNPNPIDISNWTSGAGDTYLRTYSVANLGTKNNGLKGDVLLSWFKVLDESLDGAGYSNETYFAVTNALVDPSGSAADCRQRIQISYDFAATGITSLQRLSRDTGQVEELFLPFVPGLGLQRVLTVDLDGGTMDLFKFNDGAPFVGVATPNLQTLYWDSDGSPAGNDINTGAGLGGSGNWEASPKWFNGSSHAAWPAANKAIFNGAAGTITLTAPQTANSLAFKTDGYTLAGSPLTMTSNAAITVDSGVNATINCVLAGGFGLNKFGAGTLNLASANNYSGGTVISAGTIGVNGDTAMGIEPTTPTVNLVLSSGTTLRFNAAASLNVNRQVYLLGNATIDTAGNNATVAGAILGTSSLTKIGAGTLALTNSSNNYSGGTTVNGGTLQITADRCLGVVLLSLAIGNLSLNGASLQLGANFDLSSNRGITIGSSGASIDTQNFTNAGGYSASSGFQGPGDLTKLGAGIFFCTSTLSNNLWTGSLILKEGIWKTTSRGGFPINPTSGGLRPAQTVFDGGTLQFAATFFASEPNRGMSVTSAGGTIDTQSFAVTWAGPIAGSSSIGLTKIGSGSLRLNTNYAGTYSGAVNINEGTLQLDGGAAMGDLASISLANSPGVVLNISGNETIGSLAGGGASGGNVTLGTVTLTTGGNSSSTTFAGAISGASGKLTKTGAGTMLLTGTNTYSGITIVSAGTLAFAKSLLTSSSVSIKSGATMQMSGATTVLKTPTLSFSGAAKLDLADADLIVSGMTYSAVESLVKSGFGNFDWLGTGITSSVAAVSSSRALGIIDNASTNYTTFSGQTVSNTDILVKFTYVGDCNLDGVVSPDDFTAFVTGITGGPSVAKWGFGDFDYNGVVNPDDFTAFVAGLSAFNASGGQQLSEDFKAQLAAFASSEGIPLVLDPAPVPEPALLGVLGAAALLVRSRKRPFRASFG